MKRSLLRSLQILMAVAGMSVVTYFGVGLYGPMKGAYWRAFRTPALVRDAAVEELSADHADTQRERLLGVWRSGQGKYGLRQTISSVEGTPIGLVLVAQDGQASLVLDYTRDAYGSRRFEVQPVEALGLAPSATWHAWPGGFGSTRLRCTLRTKEAEWF